jgi:hypothetical protein
MDGTCTTSHASTGIEMFQEKIKIKIKIKFKFGGP